MFLSIWCSFAIVYNKNISMIDKQRDIMIGLDLSFNSTGICMMIVEDGEPTYMNFELLLFDKKYKPIRGVTQNTYKLPTNATPESLTIDGLNDEYTTDQNYINLRYIMAAKNVLAIVKSYVSKHGEFDNIVIGIEGFISPNIMGNMQFRSITGLIMMQSIIREELISTYHHKLKMNIISPSHLKLFFTGKGNATKFDMLYSFLHTFDGEKLIDCSSLAKINDLVDGFALNVCIFVRFYHTELYNTMNVTKSKIKTKKIKNNNVALAPNGKVKKTKRKVNDTINFEQWLPTEN